MRFGVGTKVLRAAALVVTLGAAGYANATPWLYSGVSPFFANGGTGTDAGLQVSSSTGAYVNSNGVAQFSGLGAGGNGASMSLSYSGQAQASTSALKAVIAASLATPFYNASNPAYWTPYADYSGGTIDPAGVPVGVGASSSAQFSDTFAVAGGAGLAYVTFSLSLDGGIIGSPRGYDTANAVLYQTGSSFTTLWVSGNASSTLTDYDVAVSTTQLTVNSGSVTFGLSLLANIYFSLNQGYGYSETETYFGNVDFFNTVTIGSVAGFDANGKPVDLTSVVGSDGSRFATVRVADPGDPNQVPEPASLALIGIGLVGLVARRRKRKQA